MGSSGTREESRIEGRECGATDDDGLACEWEGDVDVAYDVEDLSVWWECPACRTQHEEEWPWE